VKEWMEPAHFEDHIQKWNILPGPFSGCAMRQSSYKASCLNLRTTRCFSPALQTLCVSRNVASLATTRSEYTLVSLVLTVRNLVQANIPCISRTGFAGHSARCADTIT
jgi:hypothetical protein